MRFPIARRSCTAPILLGALTAITLAPAATAQTSVQGVSINRPDQNPTNVRRREPPPPRFIAARNPDTPITPFTLTSLTVEGSSLPQADLASVYRPFIGQRIDNAALTKIVQGLAEVYGRSDIALYSVLVPNQRFSGGAVRLVAVEGYVGTVQVRGHLRRQREALLRAYLKRITDERPLRRSTLQRYVSLIRDLPGFFPTLDFKAGDHPGAVQLDIVAKEKPVQVAIGINDRGTALLGRTQVQGDVFVNGVFGGGDQLRLTTVLPTEVSRFQYYAGSYATPVDADGTIVTVNGSYLRTRPKDIPLKGNAASFGVQVSHPLIRGYKRNLFVTLGLDGLNSNNALLGFTLSNDRVRALRLAVSYSTSSNRNQLTISATGSFGLDVLGARVVPGASDQTFRKLNLKATDALQIGKTFVLRASAFGQATNDLLPSSEQIALGGDEFGRAYENAIIAGDYGYAGSAELAWRPAGLPKPIAGSELYGFTDGGRTWYRGRFGASTTESHLASVGGGIRLQVASRAIVQVEAVHGLTNPVFYENRKKTRILFAVRTTF